MQYNLNVNKMTMKTAMLMLIIAVAFSTSAATPLTDANQKSVSEVAISKYQAAQRNQSLNDEEKIKAAIEAYFTTRYEGQKLLKDQDFSAVLEDTTADWVRKEKDRREIELYNATLFDLKYHSYSYTLDYDAIDIENDVAIVTLRESHKVVFEAIAPEVSELSNLKHVFTLHGENGIWTIYMDEYQDELSRAFAQNTKEQLRQQIDRNYREIQKGASRNTEPELPVVHRYNRRAAISYAETYRNYDTKNPAYLSMYSDDGYGGDCVNYVSQIIYAGAPKMNATDWNYDNKGTSSTRDDTWTYSWSVVDNLYTFLTSNKGSGPYGWNATLCGMSPGDVIQLSSDDGNFYFHNVAVHKKLLINLNCADQINYTIIGHDNDRYNYPLTNYAVYTLRYIKIGGWRP